MSEDDLIQRLDDAAGQLQTGGPVDSLLTGMLADFDTLVNQVRQPVAIDPCFEESELPSALQRALAIGSVSVTEDLGGKKSKPVAPVVVKTVLGQYELLDQIGSGGMGAVFRARHVRLDRIVALKMLSPGRLQSREAIARFEREMRAAGNLHHPNIVAAQDAGEIHGAHFLAMELVDGCDLSTLIKDHGPLRISDACEIVRQAAVGLQHFSDHGLIHRDIKPSNLMLARPATTGATPLVKILDLGLAQFATGEVDPSHDITSTGQVIGTVDYMAPEQGLGGGSRLDIRADLYSLGATLFKLISGRAPFEEPQYNTTLKRLKALEDAAPPKLADLVADCPAELAALVARLLSKSPEGRPASPDELVRELEPFARGADLNSLLQHLPPLQTISLSETITKTFERDSTDDTFAKPLATPANRPPVRKRWPIIAAGLGMIGILLAVIVVVTDAGTITITAPADLKEAIGVKVLRNGQDFDTWQVGQTRNEHRIRSGRVEIRLPADKQDEFEIKPEELVIHRGDHPVFTLSRRRSADPKLSTPSGPKPLSPAITASGPLALREPLPLKEWLQGRTILTVAQDGSGQFTKIQDALNALKPGQLVKVLDRGPYRERLALESPPEDSGLISEQQAIIELPSWIRSEHSGIEGHVISFANKFRLSGFAFAIANDLEKPPYVHGLVIKQSADFILEDCAVRWPGRSEAFVGVTWFAEGPSQTCWFRNCLFANGLISNSANPKANVIVEKCFFMGSESGLDVSIADGNYGLIAIRENVFARNQMGQDILLNFSQSTGHVNTLQIANNTTLAVTPVTVSANVPTGRIQIHNHLRLNPGLMRFVNHAEVEQPRAVRAWIASHNAYPRALRAGEHGLPIGSLFPTAETDVVAPVEFLSTDLSHRDYLRVPEDSRQGRSGVGGAWPKHIGALPPGPAPQEGDWFTRIRERWMGNLFEQSDLATPFAIAEPPPLNEWLKDRKVLTVAQDGSGQFQTIQAALNALQTGEVVKVLDKGPYRERLEAWTLPPDSGLISEVQTVLEAPQWKEHFKDKDPATGGEIQIYAAHILSGAIAFRLHGFEMRYPPSDGQNVRRLSTSQTKQFVLENCVFHAAESFDGDPVDIGDWDAGNGVGMTVWVRECIIEGSAVFTANYKGPDDAKRQSTVVIERNYFAGVGTEHHLMIVGSAMKNVVIRHNVFAGKSTRDILLTRPDAPIHFEVSNNSLLSPNGITFGVSVPQAGVTIRNNLHSRSGFVTFFGDDGTVLREAAQRWIMDHNAYPELLVGNRHPSVLPRQPGDISILPRFLSKVPQEADYLRIPQDDQLATAGAGGAWPQYIGALPPGPATKAGDWFSRLRERWLIQDVKRPGPSSPIRTPEPPSLADWSKDRTTLTVARDGSGQFKTIAEAFRVLKAGQVVRILDRGPYRELLRYAVPPDTGIISEVGTVIDVAEWPANGGAHQLSAMEGFRLHGLRFQVPPRDGWFDILFATRPSGLVVENCSFGLSTPATKTPTFLSLQMSFDPDQRERQPVWIRECLFEYGGVGLPAGAIANGTIVVERNLFRQSGMAVTHTNLQTLIIRHNLFEVPTINPLWIDDLKKVHELLEITNNTATLSQSEKNCGFSFVTAAPETNVVIRNNLSDSNIGTGPGAAKVRASASKNWIMDHNGYAREWGAFVKAGSDIVGRYEFLSDQPDDLNAWRLPAESPFARGGAGGNLPSYMGALPPGPAPADGDWFTRLRERWLLNANQE